MIKNILRFFYYKLIKLKIILTKTFKLSKIYTLTNDQIKTNKQHSLEIIIFSKDRPLQLLALLESLEHYSSYKILPRVIYNSKDENYERAYQNLFEKYPHLYQSKTSDKSTGFKTALLNLLESLKSDAVVCLVDDILIKNYFDWKELLKYDLNQIVPCLRLGEHLNFCYTADDGQILPPYKVIDNKMWFYWKEGEHDWKYPMSLDGNVFDRMEFVEMCKALSFKAPNSLELMLRNQFQHRYLHRLGFCFIESIILNNPVNKVQTENDNFHGKVHQDDLLKLWCEGKKIDFKSYQGMKNISCHQEVELKLIN